MFPEGAHSCNVVSQDLGAVCRHILPTPSSTTPYDCAGTDRRCMPVHSSCFRRLLVGGGATGGAAADSCDGDLVRTAHHLRPPPSTITLSIAVAGPV